MSIKVLVWTTEVGEKNQKTLKLIRPLIVSLVAGAEKVSKYLLVKISK